jgi:hypothetical protein
LKQLSASSQAQRKRSIACSSTRQGAEPRSTRCGQLHRLWLRAQNANELYTTAVTVAEIRYGISRLPDGRRKDLLTDAAAGVFSAFSEKISSRGYHPHI